jgi:phage terminase large subunit-like protein
VEARPYAEIAKGYARDVTSGKIVAGKSIRLQCRRFLEELKASKRADFPHRFDADKAARVCRFIERLPHSKGKWARKKETLRLEPWQIWILACSFGWLRKRDGLRRFRVLFVVVPRKNGKSALSAGVGLFMLCADGEFGAEVYSGATNEKQAWEVFKPAQLMAKRTPALLARFGIEVNAKSLVCVADNSKFETIVGDPGDGQSPSCSIHDEYHEHADDGQVDTMQTGMGARDQPLQVLITTAGDNLAGPCYASIQEQRKRLEGIGIFDEAFERLAACGLSPGPTLEDETFFVEYAPDEGDDWKAEATLRKANPNFDVSVSGDFLKARQRDAIATPRKAGVFKTKHLNLWVSTKAAFFDVEAWRKCRDPSMPLKATEALALPELAGRRCILGLDLASKIDIAALEYLFLPIGAKATVDDPYIRVGRYFVPSSRVEDVEAYAAWDALGLLDVTEGNIVDYDEIQEAIEEAVSRFQVEQVAYDPHQATMLVTSLTKKGVPVVEYRPLVLNFSEPMKELDALTKSLGIRHAGCPVMEWEISNVVSAPDKKDNVYPNKPDGQPHLKIDNPVALISALGVAMNKEEEPVAVSPWDDPEFSMSGAA